MLWKKTGWFWKIGLAAISFMMVLGISGCGDISLEETGALEKESRTQEFVQGMEDDADEIADICLDLYKKAAEENTTHDLETVRSIINCFGENGYPAVDSKNQIDMTETEQVIRFCEKVEAQEEAEITILEVGYLGGFVKYDLQTKDGMV